MAIKVPTDAYCTVEDVQEHLPARVYDANSRPTVFQVEKRIKRLGTEINVVLRALGYTPPLTGTEDIEVLKEINSLGAAASAEAATLAITPSADQTAVDRLDTNFTRMMDIMRKGGYKFKLADAPELLNPDINDDLDESGDRVDPLFILDMGEQEF